MTKINAKSGGLRLRDQRKSSLPNEPLISVITVVFNGEKHLEQTIQSVQRQTYSNIEYIIIDGGSSDGTLELIKQYEDQIDYWVSEPDGGIYYAMNKGVSLATGDYIAFLNADDWYNSDSLQRIAEAINMNQSDYIFGNVDIYQNDIYHSVLKKQFEQSKFNTPFGHPALFVKKMHLVQMPFDTSYRVIADYDFILKLIKNGFTYQYLDYSLTNFRLGGISSTAKMNKEKFRLYYTHFGLFRAIYSYLLVTQNPLIKPINRIINALRFLRKKVLTQ